MLIFVIYGSLALLFLTIQHFTVKFMAKRDGFKSISYNLSQLGPVVQFWRWGSVAIGRSRWSRTVKITAFEQHIHLKLIRLMGGGEMLLPLENASYSFSLTAYGENVNILLENKTYTFGREVAALIRQHYL